MCIYSINNYLINSPLELATYSFGLTSTYHIVWEKKEEIWLSPVTKAPTPTEMSKGQSDNTNNATKKFECTAVEQFVNMSILLRSIWFPPMILYMISSHNIIKGGTTTSATNCVWVILLTTDNEFHIRMAVFSKLHIAWYCTLYVTTFKRQAVLNIF